MMIRAYDEEYLPLCQRVMGDMLDYAVNTLEYNLQKFFTMFLVSGIARQFEIANPAYVAGKNGCEVAKEVLVRSGLALPDVEDVMYLDKSPEYWCGWALAYYQWYCGQSFREIIRQVPIMDICLMYHPLHEADIERFVITMETYNTDALRETQLKRLRAYARLSQKQLADKSGVPLRQIQLFEQRQRDINKTQAATLLKLARALRCSCEQLMDP